MNWKWKAHGLAVLSRIPGGHRAYHLLQRTAGTNRMDLDRDLARAYELVDLIYESDSDVAGATCVEIGTGWRPFVPFVLALAGAESVVTIDVNPWLTLRYAREAWIALQPRLDEIASRCGVSAAFVRSQYGLVDPHTRRLSGLLAPLGIEYRYPGDARRTQLPGDSVDVVLSSNVLEHIPRDVQAEIHQETRRILKPGGVAVHRFNPQDHYATVDTGISNANFLQFSAADWHWLGGSGLAYHNRLRARDYYELFAAAELDMAVARERLDQRSLDDIRSGQLRVHPEFAGYSPEELAVDYMWLACRKPIACALHRDEAAKTKAFTRA